MTAADVRRWTIWFVLPLVICYGIAWIAFPSLVYTLDTVYQSFPVSPTARYQTFSGIVASIAALSGVLIALLTFLFSSWLSRNAQRKQHTITILLETRLSQEFRTINRARMIAYPSGNTICKDGVAVDRKANYQIDPSKFCRRSGADALGSMLNYYEFLAVGLAKKDLDQGMLKETIRGIMCRLVDDARFVIAHQRNQNSKTFRHLIPLYEKWRDNCATDSKGELNEREIPEI